MALKPFQPSNDRAWLECMHLVQKESDAWEALYLDKPSFSSNLDFCFWEGSELVGILAGHHVSNRPEKYSIEILAVHPRFQKRGIAKSMVMNILELLPNGTQLSCWTRNFEAMEFYKKMNFKKETTLNYTRENVNLNKQNWILNHSKEGSLVEFSYIS